MSEREHAGEASQTLPKPAVRKPSLRRSLLMFFSIIGPGIITANADNDVGGITTYSLAGAQFGYTMLWLLIPVTIALIVTQEMCARMGAVTGKGLADLIRENFGVKITTIVLLLFVLGDLGNTAAEFAGIASAAPIFQSYAPSAIAPFLSKFVMVPVLAFLVFTAVTRGNYKIVERIFFFFCTVYLAYVVSGIMVHPNWHEVFTATLVPHFTPTSAYLVTAIGVIGTTISPWMQFYIQSAVVEKGIRVKEYGYSRLDVISGALITDVIAYFIVVASAATIFIHNAHLGSGQTPITINDAGDVAAALAPLAGKYASLLFALGLLNAAIFTASILPLSTAYYVCEAFGFESGVERRFSEAPVFYALYLSLIVVGAGFVLIPGAPLLGTIFYSQVLNGALLPIVLFLMLLLINNRKLMGPYVNGVIFNTIAWATILIVGVLTIISIFTLSP
ncbi:MAG TPA: Nramp family divalent metal transporter [Candidatus Baltobacteraceae bacterium]|jgi:NRAMP (natural resistance-associated macrophage protein)-like metal ion transporter|nr:Nramp family divalent metal transporter [Candidatus Baltobacteraceae bacterium]